MALRIAHRRGDRSVGRTLWMILMYVSWYHVFIDERTSIVSSPVELTVR
ncbi:asparagine synthase [Halobiforma lacisalsi AJ5]|uniref:Asparagine synthase n=2 Tax=Natronobacterium TaxID=2256 RepID=M0L3C2_NATLA|nr:asparagine synthase [Halobiforma lacisalsi AJ5]